MVALSLGDMCHSTQLSLMPHPTHPTQGYRQTKQFIVAQSPMHSTTGDFWALVYEKQSPTVILLCPFQENGEVCLCLLVYISVRVCACVCVRASIHACIVCVTRPHHATHPQGIKCLLLAI